MNRVTHKLLLILVLALLATSHGFAQFSGGVQGTVRDQSGAVLTHAVITLVNTATQEMHRMSTDATGGYHFVSLSPGSYTITVDCPGFNRNVTPVVLSTGENRDVPLTLVIASVATRIEVTTEAPTLDTAETRQQLTLETQTVRDLPLAGNSVFTLMDLAPGVVGTNGTANNYNPEYFTGVSANGRSPYGNGFSVDGVNTGSNITNGTSNVMINPDAVEEVSIQTNTFTAEQGRGSSMQIAITTKSGSNTFHGTGNYLFTDQHLLAKQSLPSVTKYAPFLNQDFGGTLGGPILKNRTFFFASVDRLASKTSNSSVQTYEAPEFVAWAEQKFPNSTGTKMFQQYPVKGPVETNVQSTARDLFPSDCGPGSSTGIDCDLPVLVQGTWNTSPFRNGLQYIFRGDQILKSNDRFYGSYTHSENYGQSLAPRPAFDASNSYLTNAFQVDWTHTFSAALLNELSFSGNNLKGVNSSGGLYRIPWMGINYSLNEGAGGGNTFTQHNYTFNDVVIWSKNNHIFKFGGSYYWGNDTSLDPWDNNRPNYYFNSILDFVQDRIYSGGYGAYDPLTGSPKKYQYGAKLNTESLFAQDEWKVRPHFHLTLSIRWDDYGNPQGILGMKMTNIFVAPGSTVDEQFATAAVRQTGESEFPGRMKNNFSPRVGFAWSPRHDDEANIHGGIGLYNDWVTLGETVDRVNSNPPNYVFNNFGVTLPIKPPSTPQVGTTDNYPYGFSMPTLAANTLDANGGIQGLQSSVGGLDPHLHTPRTLNYIFGIEQLLPGKVVLDLSYNGSHTWGGLVGTDYNRKPQDLFLNGNLHRLNSSFGQMSYITNFDSIVYNAGVFSLKRNFSQRGTIQGSYTWGHDSDCYDGGERSTGYEGVADPRDLCARRGDSNFDVRNRVSASGVYRLPTPFGSNLLARHVLGGWEIGSTYIWQTGTPYGMYTNAQFDPIRDSSGKVTGLKSDSGDFNADGFQEDYPNQKAGLPLVYSRSHFIHSNYGKPVYSYSGKPDGTGADFWQPTAGFEGNGTRGHFRNQPLLDMDASLIKNNKLTRIGENWNLQFKAEFFNVLNRVNLGGINNNVTDPNFGKILGQGLSPRWVQLGGHLQF